MRNDSGVMTPYTNIRDTTNCKVIITDKNGNETGTDTLDAFGGGKGYYKIASTTNSNLNRDTVYKFSFKPISPVTKAT